MSDDRILSPIQIGLLAAFAVLVIVGMLLLAWLVGSCETKTSTRHALTQEQAMRGIELTDTREETRDTRP